MANVNHFLTEIHARKRWSRYFGMALASATNIGSASAREIVLVVFCCHFLLLTLDEVGKKSGIGVSV